MVGAAQRAYGYERHMKRRDFITLLGTQRGHSQRVRSSLPVVGFLSSASPMIAIISLSNKSGW
jgi:hypothetical protein